MFFSGLFLCEIMMNSYVKKKVYICQWSGTHRTSYALVWDYKAMCIRIYLYISCDDEGMEWFLKYLFEIIGRIMICLHFLNYYYYSITPKNN